MNAPWTLAGSFALADVAPYLVELGEPDLVCGRPSSLPLGLPWLFRTMRHGVAVRADVPEIPKVNRPGTAGKCDNPNLAGYDLVCRPDYARFEEWNLTAGTALSILSRVVVPPLPERPTSDACLDATLLVAGVVLPERGLVPLGLSAGLPEGSGCAAAFPASVPPFGRQTSPLPAGTLPLWSAPKHSGLESAERLTLAAIAIATPEGDGRVSMSARFEEMDAIPADTTIRGSFLPLPIVELDVTSASLAMLEPAPPEATYRRLDLSRPGQSAVIFAPAELAAFELPNIAGLRAALSLDARATIEVGEMTASYSTLFTFGSGNTFERWIEALRAIAIEHCRESGSGCIVR
jgi:hypothetical protein